MIPIDNEYERGVRALMWTFVIILLAGLGSCALIASMDGEASVSEQGFCDPCDKAAAPEFLSVADKVDEYMQFGDFIRAHNPRLTKAETYEIGRAVFHYSKLRGLDPHLVLAVIVVESSGDYDAVSEKGAIGLMQIMPFWTVELQITGDLFVIDRNVDAGTFILAEYIRRYGRKAGIQRYFWGGVKPDGRYLAKVERALEKIREV